MTNHHRGADGRFQRREAAKAEIDRILRQAPAEYEDTPGQLSGLVAPLAVLAALIALGALLYLFFRAVTGV
jgi:hypothetical protein